MDGILSIFQGIANSEGENLDTYLNALEEHQCFRLKGTSANDPIVQHITSVLSKPLTRQEGLILLQCYLEQCPVEALEQKGVLWLSLALKACNAKELERGGDLVYTILKTLAVKSVDIPDLSKAFISNFLNKIYDSLNTIIPTAYQSALECVETCLRLYPGPSGPSRGSIEKFLYKLTDVSDEGVALWSGKCLHLLQQVRGGGVQGISQKQAWQNYQLKLLGSLHSLLDSAFSNCTELYDDSVEKEQLNITPLALSDEPVKKAMQIYIRFRNLIKYLIAALRQPYPVPKAIAPKKILNLIARGLSVTCLMLQKNQISDNLAIGALLPQMQIHLWELLEAAILTLKSHLAMYHTSILGLVIDTLKWTSSKKSSGHQKPYASLRSSAYKALSLWCNTMKNGSRCEIIADNVIDEIIYDITPYENAFTLKVLSGAKKHMSKKARRQLHKAQNEQSNLVQTHANPSDAQAKKQILSDEGNQMLCITALQCLRNVLVSCGCFLKPTIVKTIHLKIIGLCLALSNAPFKKELLFNNNLCRLEVYNVLYTLILSPHHLCPPPTQMAITILKKAQIDDLNVKVRENCAMLLHNLEKIIHPQKESLVFPPDIREIKNAFLKVGKERLLTQSALLQDGDDDEEEDDDEDDEDEDIQDNAPTTQPSIVEDEDMVDLSAPETATADSRVSVDLTEDESFINKVAIYLDSSNDSVQYVPEKQPKKQSQPNGKSLEVRDSVEIPKSPEMTLRVEEDEDDDVEEISLAENIRKISNTSNENIVNQNENEPSPKKARLEEETEAATEGSDGGDEKDENEVCFEDIAATFVDELN